jgi:TIR domain
VGHRSEESRVPSETPRAFVSYSRADSEFALRLTEDLKAAGANVWLDQLDIEPGTPWDSAIEDALLSSGHLLVILSNVSVSSDNVRDEISYALGQQMKVIPVLYQDCKVPFRLARLQHIDFRNDYPTALKQLLRTLRLAHQTPPPPPPPPPPTDPDQQKSEEVQREAEQTRLQQEEDRKRQAEDFYRAEERKRAEDRRREEERKQLEQAEANRLAAEAERQRQATEQKRIQEQQAKEQAARIARQTQLRKTSPRPSIGRILLLAIGSGVVRTFAAALIIAMVRASGITQFSWMDSILTSAVSGLIVCLVLIRFKPQLLGKVGPVFLAWILLGVVSALFSFLPRSPAMILLVTLPAVPVGAYIGRYLARNLQPASSDGTGIGIAAIAVPLFFGQIALSSIAYSQSLTAVIAGETGILINLFVTIAEVFLLLWFIRDWGERAQPTTP